MGADEVDDVAQEVFVKAGRALGTLTGPAKLSSWIYAITLNTVRDLARKRSASLARLIAQDEGGPDAEGDGSPLPIEDARTPSPEQSAIRSEMIACYLDCVSRLPRRYYQVYVLSEFEELSSRAIARRLSVSVGAVKIRPHRARARLYQELRRNCRCYRNERGELMGEPKQAPSSVRGHGRLAPRCRFGAGAPLPVSPLPRHCWPRICPAPVTVSSRTTSGGCWRARCAAPPTWSACSVRTTASTDRW